MQRRIFFIWGVRQAFNLALKVNVSYSTIITFCCRRATQKTLFGFTNESQVSYSKVKICIGLRCNSPSRWVYFVAIKFFQLPNVLNVEGWVMVELKHFFAILWIKIKKKLLFRKPLFPLNINTSWIESISYLMIETRRRKPLI